MLRIPWLPLHAAPQALTDARESQETVSLAVPQRWTRRGCQIDPLKLALDIQHGFKNRIQVSMK